MKLQSKFNLSPKQAASWLLRHDRGVCDAVGAERMGICRASFTALVNRAEHRLAELSAAIVAAGGDPLSRETIIQTLAPRHCRQRLATAAAAAMLASTNGQGT